MFNLRIINHGNIEGFAKIESSCRDTCFLNIKCKISPNILITFLQKFPSEMMLEDFQ